jgi:hypothetical protein
MVKINWTLIVLLSLFGLAMAFATVYWIPMNIEWIFWLCIFIVSAWAIAKNAPGSYFLHGFLVSIANCVWITGTHILLYDAYMSTHPEMGKMMANLPIQGYPKIMMLYTGQIIGVLSGLVLGLFAWLASKLVKKPAASAS